MIKETSTGVDFNEIWRQIQSAARRNGQLRSSMSHITQEEHDALLRANPNLIDIVPGGTWEAPQFMLKRGAELGYHCHILRTLGGKDLGLMVTMVEKDVYVETHRVGKVKKPYSIDKIGQGELEELVMQAGDQLSHLPNDARRKPSGKAKLIGTYIPLQIR